MTQTAHMFEGNGEQTETLKTQFEFYDWSRPVQDRFLSSVNGSGVPQATLFAALPPRQPIAALALLLLGLVCLVGLTKLGFGSLEHTSAIQPAWFGAGYLIAAGAVGAGVLGIARSRRIGAELPYRAGHYLFPVGVLRAFGSQITLLPVTELRSVTAVGSRAVRLEFAARSVTFPLPAGTSVSQLEEMLRGFRAQFDAAFSARNRRALAALDPTRDSGFSNPLSSGDRLRPPKNRLPLRALLAVSLGALVGFGWFYTRNLLAERALFRNAVELNTEGSLASYLARGGHRGEVRELLLPRAKLAAARGDLTRVEAFAAANPATQIQPEIDAALKDELLSELARVQSAGTLAALEQFKAEHPSHALVLPDLSRMRQRLFQAALAQYRAAHPAEPAVVALFSELLRFAEANGPNVEIRFRRALTSSVERADSAIRRSGYYTGSQAIPSRYFDTPHAEAREQEVGAKLVEQLQAAFVPELLHFSLGAGLEGTGPLPEAKVPTLFVSYTTDMSGGFTTNRPRGVYVGLGITIQSAFVIPGKGAAYEFKDSSWLPPDVNQISRNMMTPKEVYEGNARAALERFRDRFQSRLLAVPKEH